MVEIREHKLSKFGFFYFYYLDAQNSKFLILLLFLKLILLKI